MGHILYSFYLERSNWFGSSSFTAGIQEVVHKASIIATLNKHFRIHSRTSQHISDTEKQKIREMFPEQIFDAN